MIESIQKGLNVMTVIYEIFLPWQQLTPERGSEETNSTKYNLKLFVSQTAQQNVDVEM